MTYQNSKSEFLDGLFVFEAFADTDEKCPQKDKTAGNNHFDF